MPFPRNRLYTLLIYPFLGLGLTPWVVFLNSAIITLVMPEIVRHLDGDQLHAGAFYVSVPVLMGWLHHVQFKSMKPIMQPGFIQGPRVAFSAVLGAYAMLFLNNTELDRFGVELRWAALGVLFLYEIGHLLIARAARPAGWIPFTVGVRSPLIVEAADARRRDL